MQAEGSLISNVYTSQSRIPIPNAIVTVSRRGEAGKPQLVAIRLTDSSGKTAPIVNDTPPLTDTTSPGSAVGWTTVDVAVDHPGYTRVQVEGVQIFPQTRTVQDFELLPLPLRSTRQEEQELFLVPRQNL